MTPLVLSVSGTNPDAAAIAQAARILCDGGLVVFPTETVYGLAADATNPKAVETLNHVKGRPPEKPYSLHIAEDAQVRSFVQEIPPLAQRLMQAFWPGPLTIVMPSKTGGTVGFRCPSHPVAQAFLRQCHRPVVAPSANRSGSPPPTDGAEALKALEGSYDCLLDAGPTPLGRESTVVQVIGDRIELLREGALSAQAIHAVVG